MLTHVQILIEKIQLLSPEKIAEVDDFVDFLRLRKNQAPPQKAATNLSEAVFAKIWNNPDDDIYDAL